MRSTYGPLLVLVGLAMTVVLVLLLFGNLGMRSELDALRDQMDALTAELAEGESGVSDRELVDRLDELDAAIDDLALRSGADDPGASPDDEGSDPDGALADRLDEILDRIEALDERVDEICGNVPVC